MRGYAPSPMADYPALEVLTAGGHELPVGTCLSLAQRPFVIGRAKDNALPLTSGLVSKRHCEVVFEFDRWWLRDLGTTHGTTHLGELIHDAELLHGDCFEVAGVASFRLLLREPVDHRDPEMERAIVDRPDDEQRWSVYADWLQEHGDPLGERIANPRADDRRWLGPMAGFAGRGELQVEWAHGLPARVVMRALTPLHADVGWEPRLATLLRQREFRFLRSLEVDVASFDHESATSGWGTKLLAALGLESLPLLERVTIGPGVIPHDVEVLEAPLSARRARHPRFGTTPQSLFTEWRQATLTFGARVIALNRDHVFQVGPSGADLALGAGAPSFHLAFSGSRWQLEAAERDQVQVNGLRLAAALLRPGDVLEPLPGVQLRVG